MMLPDSHFVWLTEGTPPPTLESFLVEPSELWAQHGSAIVAAWARKHPGTRPHAWWPYDAPGPRQRLGGKGTPCHEALSAYTPEYVFGIPRHWVGRSMAASYRSLKIAIKCQAFSEKNPPVYESQATYLKRHGLLAAHEAELARFDPEPLPEAYWPD